MYFNNEQTRCHFKTLKPALLTGRGYSPKASIKPTYSVATKELNKNNDTKKK